MPRVEALSAAELLAARDELAVLLEACVHGGASLGFLAPMPPSQALDFWSSLFPQVEAGGRLVLVAREDDDGAIIGSAQLAFESKPNGRHRAEVCKVMVLPSQRRRGIAAQLMHELERRARERHIRLLFLDTSEGPGGARNFYESLQYKYAGGIPDFALDPDRRPEKNAIYYKLLTGDR